MAAQSISTPSADPSTILGRSAAHSAALLPADELFGLVEEIGNLAGQIIEAAPEELRQGLAAICLQRMHSRVSELDFGLAAVA